MKFLFLHSNFPGQFRHLITVLAQDPGNQVIFGTTRQQGEIAGVKNLFTRKVALFLPKPIIMSVPSKVRFYKVKRFMLFANN